MSDSTHSGAPEQSKYNLPYEEQPDDEWMRCPWEGDPEVSKRKEGDYAKKCPCPNCRYHKFTDDPAAESSLLKRLYRWATGGDSDFCRMCSIYNDCTREDGECGWAGRVESIELTDEDNIVVKGYGIGGQPIDTDGEPCGDPE